MTSCDTTITSSVCDVGNKTFIKTFKRKCSHTHKKKKTNPKDNVLTFHLGKQSVKVF